MARQSFLKSLSVAATGIVTALRRHRNLRLQFVAAVVVIFVCTIVHISTVEWGIILICIMAVISLELINSALEEIIDHLHPGHHEKVGIAKDIAAAAVLFTAIVSAAIGCIILIPYLYIQIQ